ncbi:MAG: hypothetical protein AAGJ83_06820 [Planctomycetota bacterium]
MGKFYVQCGWEKLVLATDVAESAALCMIDRLLSPHLWIYDDPELSELDCHQHLMLEALLHLPTEIRVSERGFDRYGADAASPKSFQREQTDAAFSVPEMIVRWHKLMVGMRRLFAEAGVPRSVAVLAGAQAIEETFRSVKPR